VSEPKGGAHTDPKAAAENLKAALLRNLAELKSLPSEELMNGRYDKFRAMGVFTE
jgi:acetyl-CoA carboxylase carboxyl transferase subunit alpha